MEQAEKGEKPIRVRRGRVDSLTLYEITDHELEILEKGTPSALHLNLAILLLSTATSFLIALLTTTISNQTTKLFFVILIVVGYIIGFVLFLLWLQNRKSVSDISKKIKNRIQQETYEKIKGETEK